MPGKRLGWKCHRNKHTKTNSGIHHSQQYKRLQSMLEKEPQITSLLPFHHRFLWEQQTHGKTKPKQPVRKIQISNVISSNKTIPFNYYLLARLWIEAFLLWKEACFLFLLLLPGFDVKSKEKIAENWIWLTHGNFFRVDIWWRMIGRSFIAEIIFFSNFFMGFKNIFRVFWRPLRTKLKH